MTDDSGQSATDTVLSESDREFGFTWGETEGTLWLSNDDGDYKRVNRTFLDALTTAARDPAARADLDPEVKSLIDDLAAEGYLTAGGEVTRVPTPEDIRLAPRVAAFLVALAALCLVVAVRFEAAVDFPTDPRVNIWVLPFFLFVTLVHESGHYAAARPYMDPSIRLGLLNKIFPAVITATNGAWRCPRGIRIWIALAGPFVETVFALGLAAVYLLVFPEHSLLATILLVELSRVLFVLNPLVDGDGYWIAVDALGIVNLRSRGFRDLRALRPTGAAAYAAAAILFTVLALVAGLYAMVRIFGPL
jgi:hypothetical protein